MASFGRDGVVRVTVAKNCLIFMFCFNFPAPESTILIFDQICKSNSTDSFRRCLLSGWDCRSHMPIDYTIFRPKTKKNTTLENKKKWRSKRDTKRRKCGNSIVSLFPALGHWNWLLGFPGDILRLLFLRLTSARVLHFQFQITHTRDKPAVHDQDEDGANRWTGKK